MEDLLTNVTCGEITSTLDTLDAYVEAKLTEYKGIVLTDETMKQGKEDRAYLNKQAKFLNDKKIEVKNIYMRPYVDFETKLVAIKSKIESVSRDIDVQIKDYEQRQANIKLEECRKAWSEISADIVPYESIANPKWQNASTSLKSIREEMEAKLTDINQGLSLIDLQDFPEAIKEDVVKRFKSTMNVMTAIESGKATQKLMEEQKAREEAKRLEAEVKPVEVAPVVTPKVSPFSEFEEAKVTRTYVVTATHADLDALETMLTERGILWH